ncbi:MFS transporter [Candidatus Gracilibacteria bacterium]|nr:MFS transporter [Candidatus Gracilibacteria bacterium]
MLSRIFYSKYFSVFLITFVNGLSMTMLFPVLPFIVKGYNQPEIVLGVLLATFSLFQFIAAPIMGALSDMYGRKPVLMITQLGTFLSWIVLAIASFVPDVNIGLISLPILVIFFSRVFDGITGGNMSVAQAILADMSMPDERAKVFGMNGAVFGFSLIIGPAIGGLTIASSMGYFLTALVGGAISLITLGLMYILLRESLPEEKRKQKIKISFKQMNIFAQYGRWKHINTVRYTILMKAFIFFGFVGYTSISTLYLIDRFNFSELQTGLYLTFTGSFLIFHQAVSIRYFISRFRDRKTLLIGTLCMGISFILMGLTSNIIIFTMIYFFTILGISLCFATLGSLLSRSVNEKHQGEIMGMSTSFESFISILGPVIFTGLYTGFSISPYLYLGVLPLLGFAMSRIFFRNIEFHVEGHNTLKV